jgi:hypothetical protein
MWLDRRHVNTATTTLIRMLALHMATTAHNGLAGEYLLEPARGMALDGATHTTVADMIATASMVAATPADIMTVADIGAVTATPTLVARASAEAAVQKDSTVAEITTVVADPTAEVVSMVVAAVPVAEAVIGNPKFK